MDTTSSRVPDWFPNRLTRQRHAARKSPNSESLFGGLPQVDLLSFDAVVISLSNLIGIATFD